MVDAARGRRALPGHTTLAAAALADCGSNDEAPPEPVVLGGVAADGPLAGANFCHDLNDNAACDAGEPAGTSDADGGYRFEIMQAFLGDSSQPGAGEFVASGSRIDQVDGQAVAFNRNPAY